MNHTMKALLVSCGALVSALGVGGGATSAHAEGKTITLCWAAWDPANALVELSKDFTAKSSIGMKFEFVPWTNYADRFLNELNSKGSLCDLIIGDSQWIGGAAENGQYVKLNDFFKKEGISMDDYMPATVVGYSEWPKNSPNYWALPAMGDAVGWTYRKDWFARPDVQKDFKAKYGRDLAVPKTLDELHDIAVAPHPARKAVEVAERCFRVRIVAGGADPAVDAIRIGPVGFDGDDVETGSGDERFRQLGAGLVELVGAVRGFADQHQAGAADRVEEL